MHSIESVLADLEETWVLALDCREELSEREASPGISTVHVVHLTSSELRRHFFLSMA
jgi:hypothetical protein